MNAEKSEPIPGAGKMGMLLFLASLSVLFAASLIGYLAVRFRQESWPPAGMPPPPIGLWFSTLTILLSSYAIQKALRAIRSGRLASLQNYLAITISLGFLFLVLQAFNWVTLINDRITAYANLYAFSFFMLTGLHALHVAGGLALLGVVTRKAFAGVYSENFHPGVLYSAMYWHFLDAVWLILLIALVVV
ncbi:MAG: heme-copper oxidase subunit III [Candidatus Omnitrophica bacterium]|nr:heme-copper oxidase subunit III [Candidatus Omnitrophota bacterium]